MYEFIRGKVHSMLPGTVILEAGGMGYRVQVPLSTSGKIRTVGGEVLLLLHHIINAEQGEERLFGFLTTKERDLFQALITVKGIGPATAISIMCAADPDQIIQYIADNDVAALKKFKGVGPKSAARMVTELSDLMGKWTIPGGPAGSTKTADGPGATNSDAVLALVSLGYPQGKSEEAVTKATKKLGADTAIEAIVRQALQMV